MVFTIHNAEYGLERIGRAAYYSQRFTTVSPSYAGEVRPPACSSAQAGSPMQTKLSRAGRALDVLTAPSRSQFGPNV